YRRHRASCSQTSERYRRCACPIYIEGTLAGEHIRKALDLTSWTAATDLIAHWNEAGEIGAVRPEIPSIAEAAQKFFDDANARNLRAATIQKYRNVLEKRLLAWCEAKGIRNLRFLTPDVLRQFRAGWPDSPLSAYKNLERLKSFFRFCHHSGWMKTNPALALKPPKVDQNPTLPFTADELQKLLEACDGYPIQGIYNSGNRKRLRAMVLLLRYSGLRIRDAATLKRDRIKDGKLFLYTAKTGAPVRLPLPPKVVESLNEVPGQNPEYLFWSGNGDPKTTVADWQRSFRKLCELAKVEGGHFHRFRDTAATGWLMTGLSVEEVATLLGNSPQIVIKHYAPWVAERQRVLERKVQQSWKEDGAA
ncbi:MAG: site-specific integrase, partial [Planctomycetota bacterium]